MSEAAKMRMSKLLEDPKFRNIMLAAGWRNNGHIIGIPQSATLFNVADLLQDFELGDVVHVVVFDWFDAFRSPTRIVKVIPMRVT